MRKHGSSGGLRTSRVPSAPVFIGPTDNPTVGHLGCSPIARKQTRPSLWCWGPRPHVPHSLLPNEGHGYVKTHGNPGAFLERGTWQGYSSALLKSFTEFVKGNEKESGEEQMKILGGVSNMPSLVLVLEEKFCVRMGETGTPGSDYPSPAGLGIPLMKCRFLNTSQLVRALPPGASPLLFALESSERQTLSWPCGLAGGERDSQRRLRAQCGRGRVCERCGPLGASGRTDGRWEGRGVAVGLPPPGPCAQRAVLGGWFQHRGQRLAPDPSQGGTPGTGPQGGWPAALRRRKASQACLSIGRRQACLGQHRRGPRPAPWKDGGFQSRGTAPSRHQGGLLGLFCG